MHIFLVVLKNGNKATSIPSFSVGERFQQKKVYADEQKEATSTTEGERSGEAEKKIERRKSTRGREAGEESCKKCWDSKKKRLRADRPTQQDNALETTSVRPSSTPLALSEASFTHLRKVP